jgi:D-amino-acid dehydrogenase
MSKIKSENNKSVVVVGAGITGILAAYYLARSDYKVTVLEQERYPAMRTSFSNGGQVSVSNSEVWTTWSNVSKGIKWMFRKDAPLLIRPTPSISKIKWMTKFLWNTIRGVYAKNTAETIQLGLESRSLYQEIIKEEGLKFDQSYCGILHFYKDAKYLQDAVNVKELYNSNGCEWDVLSPKQTLSMDPALQDITDVVGGAWTASDWTGDIHKFCIELSRVLEQKYGVNFVFDAKVGSDLITNSSYLLKNYDIVVVCAGVGSVELAKLFDDSLPIYPIKGYSITINVRDEDMKHVPRVSLLDDQAKIVTSMLGNRLRIAGTAELAGENYDIRRDRIEPLLKWVHKNFPKIDTSNYSSWTCLRPMTPDMMPIVSRSNTQGVYYHTGHGHLGWTLSPATAKQLVNLIKQQD